jgi:hypothetical protein
MMLRTTPVGMTKSSFLCNRRAFFFQEEVIEATANLEIDS